MRRRAKYANKHKPIFTKKVVWHETSMLNEHGIRLRFKRLAKRRGKSKRWVEERVRMFIRERNQRQREFEQFIRELQEQFLQRQETEDGERTEPRDESEPSPA
jgi:hypothetical protein